MDDLMTPKELAEELDVSEAFLAQRRYAGDGPAYSPLGARKIRYRRSDVEAWLEAQKRTRTGAA